MDDFWVFGYGSLMWNPGFVHDQASAARVFGFRRSLCVRSWVHRGSEKAPGLVLGLDHGGSCRGMAFRVRGDDAADVLSYLRARELVTHVYLERTMPIILADGRRVSAIVYVVDRNHVQYAGALTTQEAAVTVATASGQSGANIDYVANTLSHLPRDGHSRPLAGGGGRTGVRDRLGQSALKLFQPRHGGGGSGTCGLSRTVSISSASLAVSIVSTSVSGRRPDRGPTGSAAGCGP